MTTIGIIQRKGGSGKSTVTANLAAIFSEAGKTVLVIDADDQRNTTSSIPTYVPVHHDLETLLLAEEADIETVAEPTLWNGVAIVAGSPGLSSVAAALDTMPLGHLQLRNKIRRADYDLCLIDTSPSLNILTINAMCASDGIFIPLSSTYFSLEGLAQTLNAYEKVRERLHKELKLYGIAFVIHDGRTRLANEVQKKVKEQYPGLLCRTVIGRNIKIEEAQIKRQPIQCYAPTGRSSQQYYELAGELTERIGL